MFKRIHFDTVPAIDVERARDFYRDKLGFEVERDNPYGESRWVFMRIRGADTLLHFDQQLSVPRTETPALVLVTEDVDAACETLRSRGVPIKSGPDDAPWEPGTRWAMIDDSEGNLVLIQTIR
ncbi:MAG: VOC family protein [Devosia nanyangense]|uniref:VOC family protein n=1 Tax=Devosia nanyangense TaxID=1228055 RepID=A0A933L688_9HYPH|nr:VOC family protein [Devosia nanyangense]